MVCSTCSKEIPSGVKYCIFCGHSQEVGNVSISETATETPNNNTQPLQNTSGQGDKSVVPPEIKGWSWGGFLWGWIWSIGNDTWIGLLALIPYIGFIMNIVLGIYGREWAWRNKHWSSVQYFQKTQRNWVKWWFIICGVFFGLSLVLGIIAAAVLISVNPSEQIKKAKDTMSKSTASSIRFAVESYYASNGYYPWNTSISDLSKSYSSANLSSETWLSRLVESGDYKESSLDNLKDTQFVLLKTAGSNTNPYVCYLPLSKTEAALATEKCNTSGSFVSNFSDILCLPGKAFLCLPEN